MHFMYIDIGLIKAIEQHHTVDIVCFKLIGNGNNVAEPLSHFYSNRNLYRFFNRIQNIDVQLLILSGFFV